MTNNGLLGPDQVQDGMAVRYRTILNECRHSEWSRWKNGTLHVQRRPDGSLSVLAIKERGDWAEYTDQDFNSRTRSWVVEEYEMELHHADQM